VSDLYRLATALKGASDASLNLLVQERGLSLSDYQDFFDLAQAMLTPKSQALLWASVPGQSVSALRVLASGEKISATAIGLLSDQFLIFSEQEPTPYDWVTEKLREQPKTGSLSVVQPASGLLSQAEIDRDCGSHAFEAMQAITELTFDFDQHLVREVSKGALGLPDLKRLAAHLGKTKEYVRALFELARLAGIVAITNKRFQPTPLADEWIAQDPSWRWKLLAQSWAQMAGAAQLSELQLQLKTHPSRSVAELVALAFPFLQFAPTSRIAKLAELADYIGLSETHPASWFAKVLAGSVSEAAKELGARLPTQQERIIIQADLSIIAPGPLRSSIEAEIRQFADTENIGLASGYRISPLSISSGLEEGMSEQQIRDILEKLSGGSLPQPVDYLLRESAERFGRIKIQSQPKGSVVTTSDPLLEKQLLMDSKLKHLLFSSSDHGLLTPIDCEALYHSLRENGYLAIRIDAMGKTIAPSAAHRDEELVANFSSQLDRLRNQELASAELSPQSDMERKIQLALRSKSTLEIEINANGKIMTFFLEPIGVANGRLRARDRKADIERTLPVSAITSITIG
jgi:hypothetical protein